MIVIPRSRSQKILQIEVFLLKENMISSTGSPTNQLSSRHVRGLNPIFCALNPPLTLGQPRHGVRFFGLTTRGAFLWLSVVEGQAAFSAPRLQDPGVVLIALLRFVEGCAAAVPLVYLPLWVPGWHAGSEVGS